MSAGILSRSERIARLNDRARQAMGLACVAVATEGFRALSEEDQSRVREMIESFDAFTPDNDPHGERDFGAIYQDSEGRWTTTRRGLLKPCSGRSMPTTAICGSAVRTPQTLPLPGGCSPSCLPANIEGRQSARRLTRQAARWSTKQCSLCQSRKAGSGSNRIAERNVAFSNC